MVHAIYMLSAALVLASTPIYITSISTILSYIGVRFVSYGLVCLLTQTLMREQDISYTVLMTLSIIVREWLVTTKRLSKDPAMCN